MPERALLKRNSGANPLYAAAGMMAIAASSLLGQAGPAGTPAAPSPANAPYIPTMTFDVASVRETKNIDMHTGFTMSGQFVAHTTNLRLLNWQIESLLSMAFGVNGYQIVGAPKWPWPTVFVIEGKSDSEADAKLAALPEEQQWAEQKHMLQALLEERFKLKTHWETREGDVYNLMVAKGGPKLGAEGSIPVPPEEVKMFGDRPVPVLRQKSDAQGAFFVGSRCPMSALAAAMAGQFGRPVSDKTGLTGKYDFVLRYKLRWDSDRNPDDPDPTPPLDRGLQEELGLKVEAAKGPMKVLVIDHVEKPSEN